MAEVVDARRALEEARVRASAMVGRRRALLGLAMIRARQEGRASQVSIARELGVGPQQVRAYEQAYRDWVRDHPGEPLDEEPAPAGVPAR